MEPPPIMQEYSKFMNNFVPSFNRALHLKFIDPGGLRPNANIAQSCHDNHLIVSGGFYLIDESFLPWSDHQGRENEFGASCEEKEGRGSEE
uniref:Uncharacterized protein n=1 Tax=Amphimedon queenslandica TaxID=400682 RepID=A0A1X7TYC8_AMPQE